MIQGTTPTFTLTIDSETVDLTAARNVYVTFEHRGGKLTKTGADIVVQAKTVDVYLTQEETLAFPVGSAKVQINWTYNDGSRASTIEEQILISDNLLKEVLV